MSPRPAAGWAQRAHPRARGDPRPTPRPPSSVSPSDSEVRDPGGRRAPPSRRCRQPCDPRRGVTMPPRQTSWSSVRISTTLGLRACRTARAGLSSSSSTTSGSARSSAAGVMAGPGGSGPPQARSGRGAGAAARGPAPPPAYDPGARGGRSHVARAGAAAPPQAQAPPPPWAVRGGASQA